MYSVMSSANSESFTSSFPILIPFMLLHLILNVYNYLVVFLGKKNTQNSLSPQLGCQSLEGRGYMPFISLRRNEYSIKHTLTFNFSFLNSLI